MHPYERQQFDLLLADGVQRLSERAVHRCGGHDAALTALAGDPEGEGVWLHQFTGHLLAELLLDNPAGSCFVLQALARRPAPTARPGKVEAVLAGLAEDTLAELLREKTIESLEQMSVGVA